MNTPPPEFSRVVDIGRMGDGHRQFSATPEECAALARRFDLVAIGRLEADLTLTVDGPVVTAEGRLTADIVQSCAVSGEELPVAINEAVSFRFVPETDRHPDEEVELDADDCDEIAYAGTAFDLGEAVAQSLFLAIDPFATGPQADAARRQAGILDESALSSFAALAALKPKAP